VTSVHKTPVAVSQQESETETLPSLVASEAVGNKACSASSFTLGRPRSDSDTRQAPAVLPYPTALNDENDLSERAPARKYPHAANYL